jgi:hypothetical protein
MRRVVVAVLTVLLLASVGLTGWLLVDDPEKAPETASSGTGPGTTPAIADGTYRVGSLPDRVAADALRAAVTALPVAFSFDHRHLDEDRDRATAFMTDRYAAEYRALFDEKTRPGALAEKAVTTALVQGAGVVGPVADGRVLCLVYLDRVLLRSDRQTSGTSSTPARVHVRMREVDGRWKVDGIEPF